MPSRTLMRKAVDKPEVNRRHLKAAHAIPHHEPVVLAPTKQTYFSPERLARASQIPKSNYVSHFVMPSRSHFVPTPQQPIKAIVHKPALEGLRSFDQQIMNAIENAEDQLVNLEQQPVKRLHRFTRALVANRFNGIALD